MKYMTTAEIRSKFLKYFEDKGSKIMPSSSLIPDDPSLLLTSAGMVQFKPYFLQQKKLPNQYIGTATVQKCLRTNDIDIIGTTGRHLTFFEMLGNFSFGQYFKKEMCQWALDFSVNVMKMPFERLYFSVYKDDDECIKIWKDLGVDDSHIVKLGDEDNFWRAGPTGPCGPCSELYYDQGEEFGCGKKDCAPGCDCDRFLEYWNLVFTQYDAQEDGSLKPLPKKNIDTGMGLERMAAIMQGVSNNYETDVMKSLIATGEKIFGVKYGKDAKTDLSLRIIADHARATTFMIADGILPGNEGREYVLRRLLRRSVMKAYLLGHEGPFLDKYVDETIKLMGDTYHELGDNVKLIKRVVLSEEERFGQTLEQGAKFLDDFLKTADKKKPLPGDRAFKLHDTYGFPIDVTKEIVEEQGFKIDMKGFEKCMAEQVSRARAANAEETSAAWELKSSVAGEILAENGPTKFVGYDTLECTSKIIAIIKDGKRVKTLKSGEQGSIIVYGTPFYGEMGGQVGDTGYISKTDKNEAEVVNTTVPESGLISHSVKVIGGSFKLGDDVELEVDAIRRSKIERNHTATHILHWALREVLGDHVNQAGSLVAPDRLRFDFTHFEAVTKDQIEQVEKLANDKIMRAFDLNTYNTSLKEAREKGVTALFGEKYGDEVRVVEVGDFSKELCGGCHVKNTAEIGFVKIMAETSVGSNARRIEAVTSYEAYNYVNSLISEFDKVATMLKSPYNQVAQNVQKSLDSIKEFKKELKFSQSSESTALRQEVFDEVIQTKAGYKLLVCDIEDLGRYDIKNYWDVIADHLGDNCAAVVGGTKGGKALLMAAGTSKAVKAGFNAVDVIKKISPSINGGGGGQDRMAQAGGSKPEGIAEALDAAKKLLK